MSYQICLWQFIKGVIIVEQKIKKYRKKPIVIEAYQTNTEMIIHTLEGDMKANVGDYIITGLRGEKYPCKPDIFEKSYELVKEWLLWLQILHPL